MNYGLGRNIIQYIVFFENEQKNNTTIIWPKIYKYKKKWLRTLNKRGAYYEKAN
jgi:hypothetical protein